MVNGPSSLRSLYTAGSRSVSSNLYVTGSPKEGELPFVILTQPALAHRWFRSTATDASNGSPAPISAVAKSSFPSPLKSAVVTHLG
jgi:hypothetical protein